MTTPATCPNCQQPLAKTPARKTRCPHCSEFIFVRTSGSQTLLLTAQQTEAYEAERQEAYRTAGHASAIAQILHTVNLPETKFEQEKQTLESKSSTPLSRQDEIILALEMAKYHAASNLQKTVPENLYRLAILHTQYNRPFRDILELCAYQGLQKLKQEGAISVRISTCGDQSCPACQQLSDKIYPIDQAIAEKILPHAECTHALYNDRPGFCRCEYLAKEIGYENIPTDPNKKTCDYCGEQNDLQRTTCKHCGQNLSYKFTPIAKANQIGCILALLPILIIYFLTTII